MNRQINERLRTLITAYKLLGRPFTGELSVDPAHLRSMRPASSNVSTLRNFIRKALDLEPISTELLIPHQGPLRPTVSSGKGNSGGRGEGSDKESGGHSGAGMAKGAGSLGVMPVGSSCRV